MPSLYDLMKSAEKAKKAKKAAERPVDDGAAANAAATAAVNRKYAAGTASRVHREAAADRVEREAKGFGNVNSRQGRRNRKRKAQRAVAAEAEAEAAKIAEDDDDDEVDSDEAEAEAEPKKKKMKVVAVRDTKGIDADTVMRVGPRGKVLNLDELTWVETKSGVKWIDVQVGEGPQRPVKNRMVMLHYTGYLEFGTPGEKVFDSSEGPRKPKQSGGIIKKITLKKPKFPTRIKVISNQMRNNPPFAFKFGCNPPKVIRGLEVGVKSMREGGQRIITIPSYMAYGPDGTKKIPKNAELTFDVELVAIGSRQC